MAHYYQHNCLEDLSSEHQKILGKLEELEKATENMPDQEKIKEFLDFTENFAEPHHQKEEKVLFPALEKKGIIKQGGPIGQMLLEHEMKRGYLKELEKAVKENQIKKIKAAAKNIISLLREHIDKEENILYPLAGSLLTKEELASLHYQCEKIKKDETKR